MGTAKNIYIHICSNLDCEVEHYKSCFTTNLVSIFSVSSTNFGSLPAVCAWNSQSCEHSYEFSKLTTLLDGCYRQY